MLATIETLQSGEPSDPVAWPDNGARWVVDPRRDAPGLDNFMSHVHKLGADQIQFATFQPASFRLYGRNYKVKSRAPLDERDAGLIVNHLYGADRMARLQGGQDINVMYVIGVPRREVLRFRVNITASLTSQGIGAHAVIRPVKDLPPPLEKQNVEPGILANFRMSKGLLIVSGATGSGKSTLIGGSARQAHGPQWSSQHHRVRRADRVPA